MSRALWIAKKNELCNLIKIVSDGYGGDDVDWLRDYAKEVIDAHQDDIMPAIECFKDLERQLDFIKPRRVLRETKETIPCKGKLSR